MNVTSFGRPLGSFPLFKFKDGEGGYLLVLSRVDVSDVGNKAEALYTPFFKIETRDGMETWSFHLVGSELILFFTHRGIQHHVQRNQAPEE